MTPLDQLEAEYTRAHHYEDRPRVSDVLGDLGGTKLGMKLLELLALAQDVDHKAARKEAEHVVNGRRHFYRATPEARLAERVMNAFGPPEDCFVMREIAERECAR